MLKYTKEHNATVITVIHQPSVAITEMFDKVNILTGGHSAYFGSPQNMASYFMGLNCEVPPFWNPIDKYMEFVAANGQQCIDYYAASQGEVVGMADRRISVLDFTKVAATSVGVVSGGPSYARNPLAQMLILVHRTTLRYLRNPTTSVVRLIAGVLIACLFGGLFWDLSSDIMGFRQRLVLAAFMGFLPAFMAAQAVPQFLDDRELFYQVCGGFLHPRLFATRTMLTLTPPMPLH